MSKSTITIDDQDNDGSVSVEIDFEDGTTDEHMPKALGMMCVELIQAFSNGPDAVEDFMEELIETMRDDEEEDNANFD